MMPRLMIGPISIGRLDIPLLAAALGCLHPEQRIARCLDAEAGNALDTLARALLGQIHAEQQSTPMDAIVSAMDAVNVAFRRSYGANAVGWLIPAEREIWWGKHYSGLEPLLSWGFAWLAGFHVGAADEAQNVKGRGAAQRVRANEDAFRAARSLAGKFINVSAFWDMPGERPAKPPSMVMDDIRKELRRYALAYGQAGMNWLIEHHRPCLADMPVPGMSDAAR